MMRLFFFLLLTGFSGFSQKILIKEQQAFRNAILDSSAGQIRLYFDDHYRTIDTRTFEMERHDLMVPQDPEIRDNPMGYVLKRLGGQDYFLHASGGLVYRLENDTLERIDQSFMHHMDYGAAIFEHNKTFFKYGGYGYWSVRDFFTYFDFGTAEWDAYGPIDTSLIPPGITESFYLKDGPDFFLFGGVSIGKANRKDKLVNQKLWCFDFNKNKWTYLGKHDPVKPGFRIDMGKKLVIVRQNEIQVIDILNNKVEYYDHSPVSSRVVVILSAFFFEDKFFVLMSLNDSIGLTVVEKGDFFGQMKSEGQFYHRQNKWILRMVWIVLSLALLLFGVKFIRKEIKRRKKVVLLENGLRYKNKFVEFKPESMKIMRLLLSELEVPSGKILELVEQEQYSPAHNERLKVQKIKDINLKLKTLLGINEDLIVSTKSTKDRRIRVYKISRYYFF